MGKNARGEAREGGDWNFVAERRVGCYDDLHGDVNSAGHRQAWNA